jgi:hypothetical protein
VGSGTRAIAGFFYCVRLPDQGGGEGAGGEGVPSVFGRYEDAGAGSGVKRLMFRYQKMKIRKADLTSSVF